MILSWMESIFFSFNTQPPEGGCSARPNGNCGDWFQHTAARRRLHEGTLTNTGKIVSTHSRPKAAVNTFADREAAMWFQHTAARRRLVKLSDMGLDKALVSTHSRPKAAVETNQTRKLNIMFQHTAARRRLDYLGKELQFESVSTHSRPKAADQRSYQN